MTDFGNTTHPKAAKDHCCEWCGEIIPKGETHAHFVGKWEGTWQNWRMHSECHAVAKEGDDLVDGFIAYDNERPKNHIERPEAR